MGVPCLPKTDRLNGMYFLNKSSKCGRKSSIGPVLDHDRSAEAFILSYLDRLVVCNAPGDHMKSS